MFDPEVACMQQTVCTAILVCFADVQLDQQQDVIDVFDRIRCVFVRTGGVTNVEVELFIRRAVSNRFR